jgi:hypothetical protein
MGPSTFRVVVSAVWVLLRMRPMADRSSTEAEAPHMAQIEQFGSPARVFIFAASRVNTRENMELGIPEVYKKNTHVPIGFPSYR